MIPFGPQRHLEHSGGMDLHIPTLIARKRDGAELDPAEIRQLIAAYTAGTLPDYQMSAFAMAVFFRGMTPGESAALTDAMRRSGDIFDWGSDHPPVVDKHSTGGIGDKVSLVLAPLLACDGLWVPMVSGRGLGITGGTLDKLESIPGFRVGIGMEEAKRQVERMGVVMMGQTARFCPADRKLYALRDVTGTVPSIPLITASIMSKKLAESLDRLVLDVKFGSGAFMRTREQAEALAASLVDTGRESGVLVRAVLTPMGEPLGHAVGNALEVIESLECLRGNGPADLETLVLDLAAEIADSPRETLRQWLHDGRAMAKWRELVAAQGGDLDAMDRLAGHHRAPVILDVPSEHSGLLQSMDAGTIGQAALELGAGRATADDAVDPRVGFDHLAKSGSHLTPGDLLGRVHADDESSARRAAAALRRAAVVL